MIDFNNKKQVKELKEAGESSYGKKVLEYLEQVTNERTKYNNIDLEKENSLVGEEVKVYRKTREIIKNVVNFFN